MPFPDRAWAWRALCTCLLTTSCYGKHDRKSQPQTLNGTGLHNHEEELAPDDLEKEKLQKCTIADFAEFKAKTLTPKPLREAI